MAAASRLPVSRNATVRQARNCGCFLVLALVPALAALLAPASARGDIYKWTDEQGGTVISDVPPVDAGKVSGMKLLAAAPKPAMRPPATTSVPAESTKEQELEARIEQLERELQEQQSAQQQPLPYAGDSDSYYFAPPPPPESDYYGSYGPDYYAGYYPTYYYPPPPAYVVVAAGRPLLRRPAPAHRPAFVPRPVRVNPPVFVRRAPPFAARPSVFASRPAAFTSRPAPVMARGAAPGGGFAHHGRR